MTIKACFMKWRIRFKTLEERLDSTRNLKFKERNFNSSMKKMFKNNNCLYLEESLESLVISLRACIMKIKKCFLRESTAKNCFQVVLLMLIWFSHTIKISDPLKIIKREITKLQVCHHKVQSSILEELLIMLTIILGIEAIPIRRMRERSCHLSI